MNAVIYARYSSTAQRDTSIEIQLRDCRKYCEDNGYTVVKEYIDRAKSGTNDDRPDFQRMIRDSSKKMFDCVIVYRFNRFARSRTDSVVYKKNLKKNGVRVISVHEQISEDPTGVILESLIEGLDEYYSLELRQKVKNGMDSNGAKCLSTGGTIPLGYKVGKDKRFEINPETAPIVQMIFEMYSNGKTVAEITDHLNSLGFKTSRGASFNKNSLTTILRNKKYIGIYTYKGTETPGGMPAIISTELFEKVAKIMEKNKKAPARAKAKAKYLLTTKMFCGYCKEMMTGISGTGESRKIYRYYTCNGKKNKNCEKKMISKERIENIVLAECRKVLSPSNIAKISFEIAKLCEEEKDTSTLIYLKKAIADNERKHKNTIDAITECEIDSVRKTLYQKVQTLEAEHTELEHEIALESAVLPTLTEPKIRFFLTSLRDGSLTDIKYKKTLITVLVNTVYLYNNKVTITFNSGDIPVTIDDILLSKISEGTSCPEGLFFNRDGPPTQRNPNFVPIGTAFGFLVFMDEIGI